MTHGMKSKDDVERLEKLIGQLKAVHSEIGQLAKKSPNDGVNKFKLKLVNGVIALGNEVLGEYYRPLSDFEFFNEDDVPSNSDVTMVVAHYLEEAERYRSDNVVQSSGRFYYMIDGEESDIRAASPTWSRK